MDNLLIPAYISACAGLLGIAMDAARIERVAAHMQRTAAMAALLEGTDLAVHENWLRFTALQPSQATKTGTIRYEKNSI